MPFGFKNALAIVQRMIDNTLSLLLGNCCIAYMDYILVFSPLEDQHKLDLEKVMLALSCWLLKLKRSKCNFFKKKSIFLVLSSLKMVTLPALINFWPLSSEKT